MVKAFIFSSIKDIDEKSNLKNGIQNLHVKNLHMSIHMIIKANMRLLLQSVIRCFLTNKSFVLLLELYQT